MCIGVYAGQYFDEETGLHYNLNRYYNPKTGRYLRADPFGDGLNLYAYCYNNPQGLIDPLGLCAIKDFRQWIRDYAPDGLLDAIGITILATLDTVIVGILNSPHDLANQIYDFVHDPLNPNKIPILGPLGQAIGLTTAMAFDDPNAVTISQAIGAYSSGILTAFGGSAIKGRLTTPKNTTTVIGRVKDLKNLKQGQRSLLNRLPNRGNPKANWKQNSGVLRQVMAKGRPIRDASPGDTAGQFLNAERNLLRSRGWTFDSKTNYWMPPK